MQMSLSNAGSELSLLAAELKLYLSCYAYEYGEPLDSQFGTAEG